MSDRTNGLWDYSTLSEEIIMQLCINTGRKIEL